VDPGSDSVTSFLATDERALPQKSGEHVDIGAVEVQMASAPHLLTGLTRPGNGFIHFGFTNLVGGSFTVFATTNLTQPFNTWSNLGAALEIPVGSGQFQFTDLQATNNVRRFCRVRSP